MPTAASILAEAFEIANERRLIAELWHVFAAVVLLALLVGWRPGRRLLASALVLPVASVSLIAWASGNPFNGLTCAVLASLLAVFICRVNGGERLQVASVPFAGAGAGLVALGLVYPHFLRTDAWLSYLYAAPVGLLPCPTLMVVIGTTLAFRNLASPGWRIVLAAAALFYGALGVFRLDVWLDWPLLASGAVLVAQAAHSLRPPVASRGRIPGTNREVRT